MSPMKIKIRRPRKNNFRFCRCPFNQTRFEMRESSKALIDNWSLKICHLQLSPASPSAQWPMTNCQWPIINGLREWAFRRDLDYV